MAAAEGLGNLLLMGLTGIGTWWFTLLLVTLVAMLRLCAGSTSDRRVRIKPSSRPMDSRARPQHLLQEESPPPLPVAATPSSSLRVSSSSALALPIRLVMTCGWWLTVFCHRYCICKCDCRGADALAGHSLPMDAYVGALQLP